MVKKNNKKTNSNALKYGKILGISILSIRKERLLASISQKLAYNSNSKQNKAGFSVFTVNPELVLMSIKNRELFNAMNSCAYPVSEAIGITQSLKYLSLPVPGNPLIRFVFCLFQGVVVGVSTFLAPKWLKSVGSPIKGRILFMDLIRLSSQKNYKIFLLGGSGQEATLAAKTLQIKYKNLKIDAARGPNLDIKGEPVSESDKKTQKDAIDKINNLAPDFLFVAFGNPKQELWIFKNLKKLKVKGAMAVGGTFRYVAGLSLLPPRWMGELGLEWVWRFITEPYRLKRIVNAVIVFPFRVFLFKILSS